MFNPFKSPIVVGIGFIIFGLLYILKSDIFVKKPLFYKFFKEKANKIFDIITGILYIWGGICILIWVK